jgi:anti-sigma regulatory factor (Ser/Thr protein kinase)
VDGASSEDLRALRREVTDYLRRHAEDESDVEPAVLIVGELLSNVHRHAAGPAWVHISWAETRPTLQVRDLGPGLRLEVTFPEAASIGGRGLFIASSFSDQLTAAHRASGGSVVTARLDVPRRPEKDVNPSRRTSGVLPSLDEATPGVGFAKEPFLRALVVQLANTVEHQLGPTAAEALVAQVGTDVGGQMEREYRSASDAQGRLRPEEIAACLVRLKQAIDGNFRVEAIHHDRIVLVTDTCPFGEAVRRAPSLCRMTSSVFGGIAARNSPDGATVVLEERIAVGDPGCRVTVYLGAASDDAGAVGHRYPPPNS